MTSRFDQGGGLLGLLGCVCTDVRQAGSVALDIYAHAEVKNWEKGKDNPLTEADLAVDRLLHGKLLGACPDFGWLSEETVDNASRLARDDLVKKRSDLERKLAAAESRIELLQRPGPGEGQIPADLPLVGQLATGLDVPEMVETAVRAALAERYLTWILDGEAMFGDRRHA